MQQALETLILLAFVGLLLLLRFDAQRFGAAEYDDEEAPGWRIWVRRFSWYVSGIVLILLIYRLHQYPLSVLHLQLGDDRLESILAGLALGTMGTVVAFGYAWWRFGGLRLPPARRYPAGLLNSLGSAFIDEAAFRGILLGLFVAAGWPVGLAIGGQAVLYAMATRLAGRGRPLGMLALSLGIGIVGGWVTVQTAGIGAAFLGHVLTRFAIFAATGHAGQLRSRDDEEDEAQDESDLPPDGWEVISDRGPGMGTQYR